MKTIPISLTTFLCTAILGLSITANAQTFTFGSANDGVAGFTQSATTGSQTWGTNANDVTFTQPNNSLENNSLLKEFIFDRSNGNSYTITGTMTWSAEADRNNRQGIYLFGNADEVTNELATGEISLQYQADARAMRASIGLNGGTLETDITPADAPATNNVFTNEPFTFQAEISFVNNGGTDQIEILYTMFNEFGASTASNTMPLITVDAADYSGTYFGFAGRTRDDGASDSIASYQSFAIIPEPSTFLLVGLAGLGFLFFRRRHA
jgi:hypothetical protein